MFLIVKSVCYTIVVRLECGKMYQALYRKYRPILFKDVVGQTSIVKILQNSIINNHVGHAYMFFGPRGTGKTSLAKIFARTINCLNLKDGEICETCDCCNEMLSSNSVDIIEIDAASNNGVDEIRELKNKINLVPNQLKYKVYIIDEVHMLSIGAFNALLKTLEEPPEHIVFILATTDPQKVPETIKSRCQCFQFKRISEGEIVNKLEQICNEEQMSVEKTVLEHIAVASCGGLRDSLSMLDVLYSTCGKNISMTDYIEMNDLIDDKELEDLLQQILSGDMDSFLSNIEKLNSCGKNLIQICELLLYQGRNLVVKSYKGELDIEINLSSLEQLLFLLNEKMVDVKRASNPRIYIEIMMLKFINEFVKCQSKEEIISREIILEQKFDNEQGSVSNESEKVATVNPLDDVKKEVVNDVKNEKEFFEKEDSCDKIENDFIEKYREIMSVRLNNTLCKADKNILLDVKQKFKLINEYVFDPEIGYLVCALMDGEIRVASEENIVLSVEYDSMIDANIKNMEKLEEMLKKITGIEQHLSFITHDIWNLKKQEYIQKLQSGDNYQYLQEPSIPVLKQQNKEDELVSRAVELFGDIVEEE